MDYIPVSKVLNHFIVVDDDKTFITARELHIGIPTWCLALVWLAWIPAKAGAPLCAWGSMESKCQKAFRLPSCAVGVHFWNESAAYPKPGVEEGSAI
jgi:hypothetical protein